MVRRRVSSLSRILEKSITHPPLSQSMEEFPCFLSIQQCWQCRKDATLCDYHEHVLTSRTSAGYGSKSPISCWLRRGTKPAPYAPPTPPLGEPSVSERRQGRIWPMGYGRALTLRRSSIRRNDAIA